MPNQEARARLRRLMKSGCLRKALISLAESQSGQNIKCQDSSGSSFVSAANLVAGFVELEDIRKAAGIDDGLTSSTFFKRFVAKATSAEDNTKSVEKQAEMANSGNDK